MRKIALIPALVLAAVLVGSAPVYAQTHVVGEADLHGAVVNRAEAAEAQRETIRSLLRRQEVRDLAREAGLDVKRAEGAVAGLQGPELARLAAQASQANAQLVGGDQITISTTTIIIILLVLIILLIIA